MIEITDAAKAEIKTVLDNNPGKYLRITVEGDGCAGPYFGLSFDEAEANEVPARIDGIDILMSEHVRRLAEITTIRVTGLRVTG